MHSLDKTAWEILNATADDWENLEQIHNQVCFDFSPEHYENRDRNAYYLRPAIGAPSLKEIADHVLQLVETGLLATRQVDSGSAVPDLNDRSFVWRAGFRMTPKGKELWESSEHANLVERE